MTTKRENILSAIKTKLDAVSGITGVFREMPFPVSQLQQPCIKLDWQRDTPDTSNVNFYDWRLEVIIAVLVRGAIPSQVADSIVAAIYNTVMADRGLGGLAMDIVPGQVQNAVYEGDNTIGVIQNFFYVTYRNPAASI